MSERKSPEKVVADALQDAILPMRRELNQEQRWDVSVRAVEALREVGMLATEWEYSVGFNEPGLGWINDGSEIYDNYYDARSMYDEFDRLVEDRVIRRRKAGPWEVVL